MKLEYSGIIVEESLDDNRLINGLKIEKVHITGHKKREHRRHEYLVKVSQEQIEALQRHINEESFLYFWKDTTIIALFPNKRFDFDYLNKDTWNNVMEYGLSIGIPENDLEFNITGL